MNDASPVLVNLDNQRKVTLSGRLITVGSSSTAHVKVANSLPKQLAQILFRSGVYRLQRLASKKPVSVNGLELETQCDLQDGDVVAFGPEKYRFQLRGDSAQTPPARDAQAPSPAKLRTPVHQFIDILVSLLKDRHSEVFAELVSSVSRLLHCDAARLLHDDGSEGGAKTVATFPDGVPLHRFSNQALSWARKSLKTVLADNADWSESPEAFASLRRNRVGSVLCVPLLRGDSILGYLYLDRLKNSKPFSEEERALCDILKPLFEEVLLYREEHRRQKKAIADLQESRPNQRHNILHDCEPMKELMATAERVAKTETTVLIQGETGTGKELLARFIHEASNRGQKTFVAVNCGAIPSNLMESELFGHMKGSFTGAHQDRRGVFEAAHKGTLFLDEVAELPPDMQVKLLRVLQEGEVMRVGSTTPVSVDVRIVSASNTDLGEAVQKGAFREDLFYRLNVIQLKLPPLRERSRDPLLIADYLIRKYCQQFGLPPKFLSAAAEKALLAHTWPGNIRELNNLMQKAVLMSNGEKIGAEDLDVPGQDSGPTGSSLRTSKTAGSTSLKSILAETKRQAIENALKKWKGNVSQTARQLDTDRAWLIKMMQQMGMDPDEFKRN